MKHRVLEAIRSDAFLVRFGVTGNARAIHRALERSEEVDAIRLALYQGEIDEESLRDLVAGLFRGFQPGVLFAHDLTLAAVAVVLENRPTRTAEEFVSELARVDCPELPLASRVAQECLRVQMRQSGSLSRVCRLGTPDGLPARWEEAPTFLEMDCGQHRADVTFEGPSCRS